MEMLKPSTPTHQRQSQPPTFAKCLFDPSSLKKIGESKAYRFPSPLDPIEVAWQKIVAGNLLQCGWCL